MSRATTSAPNLGRLDECYSTAANDQVALLLGAGVNGGAWATEHPACANWPKLLEALAEKFQRRDDFEASVEAEGADWIRAATTRLSGIKRGAIVNATDEIIYQEVFSNPSSRNPKIRRVLTTNYDFFLGAAWPRYTSMKRSWWPATWTSAVTRSRSAAPIVYLHGYLPYSGDGEKDVMITQQDYTDATLDLAARIQDSRGASLRKP